MRSAVVNATKFLGGNAELVAADPESHDRFRIAALCGFNHLHGGVRTELARGIEHPSKPEPTFLERLGGAKEGFEICFRLLFSEEHDADGKSDFRIDHALRKQMFSKIGGDERVVLRLAQERSDPFESFDEFGEIAIGVTSPYFPLGCDGGMTSRQRADRFGLDGAFKMQVQFGFWEGSNPVGEQGRRHPRKISAATAGCRRFSMP